MKTIKSKEDEIKNLNKMICDKCGHVLKISEEHEIKLKEELQENNLHLTELMLLKDSHKDELKHLKEAEKLLQDPRFKQWYDQVNNSQTSNDTEQGQSTGGNDTSALLGMIGGSSGALGLETIKKIASFLV